MGRRRVGNRVVRLAEGGEILAEIPTGDGCFACMLGGDDGRTLFLCVAPDFHGEPAPPPMRAASCRRPSTSPTPAPLAPERARTGSGQDQRTGMP